MRYAVFVLCLEAIVIVSVGCGRGGSSSGSEELRSTTCDFPIHWPPRDPEEAIEAWNTLFKDYPSSDKLPDGRVKKGMALERLGRKSQALIEYRYVVDRYPNSQAAKIARERLTP